MDRYNPLNDDEAITLKRARLERTPATDLSRPMSGPTSGIQAGKTDGAGVFHRAGLTGLDATGSFYTASGPKG
jgi:hypothetical protein